VDQPGQPGPDRRRTGFQLYPAQEKISGWTPDPGTDLDLISILLVAIVRPALIIGLTTFGLSLLGVYIGKKVGRWLNRRVELLGGLILVLIGIKILIEHLR
jgi:hypothetical protein